MPINHRALGRTEGKPEENKDKENVPQMSYLANYKAYPDFVKVSTYSLNDPLLITTSKKISNPFSLLIHTVQQLTFVCS